MNELAMCESLLRLQLWHHLLGYSKYCLFVQAAVNCYEALDERLFVNYIEEKANPIIGSLEQNMYTGRFDWSQCPRPTGEQK